jgi:hypothetical protein
LVLKLVKLAVLWIVKNGTFKLYTADTPIGKKLGTHDDPTLPNRYIIIDIEASDHILLLGYFQVS